MVLRLVPSNWSPASIEEIKSASEFPADAVFRGYVVHLRETDEFLVSAKQTKVGKRKLGAPLRAWSKRPSDARVFKSDKQAWSFAFDCGNRTAEVVHLFETATQFLVTVNGD